MNVKRTAALSLLILMGIGSFLFGMLFHTALVEEEKEREITIAVPTMSGFDEPPPDLPENADKPAEEQPAPNDMNPFESPSAGGDSENPFESPPLPTPSIPGIKMEKVTEKYAEFHNDPEWVIVRDITVGGIVRLANGPLKRTYSGKAPSLCPS